MKRMTLENSFHETNVTILVPSDVDNQADAWYWISQEASREWTSGPARARYNRVRRTLCPSHREGCKCGVVRP